MFKKVNLSLFLVAGMLIFTLSLAFSQSAKAATPIVPILSEFNGAAYTLTRVYTGPDDTSRVIEVLSPGTHFNILGFDDSGKYIEIAKDGQALPIGWVTISEVLLNHLDGMSLSLTEAYSLPSSTSPVATIFSPGTELQVLGHSQDGSFLAIQDASAPQGFAYWVPASMVKLPDVIARTAEFNKVLSKTRYQQPYYQCSSPSTAGSSVRS